MKWGHFLAFQFTITQTTTTYEQSNSHWNWSFMISSIRVTDKLGQISSKSSKLTYKITISVAVLNGTKTGGDKQGVTTCTWSGDMCTCIIGGTCETTSAKRKGETVLDDVQLEIRKFSYCHWVEFWENPWNLEEKLKRFWWFTTRDEEV